ncbi:bifunctional metallophosphatase/5'-nucleotidase [Staphylococcus canis]|uniref:Bifunctional metallophosphatase/5'-nucleotidase n=1 Tax=Staphylococcus canis TaxID=2724942 RepID=A0ABS0T928_9STAP|nr:bifunctional UDP-sugar hydrolase/5'-nucleotidase [Staphylococcus canis]MBI5975250.1 bifunctional metallophosphatase/5'-nucleotidase [Staphylococcus canis]
MTQHDTIHIHILATSDMHSHILNENNSSHIYRAGTYIDEVRRQHQNVLLFDNGSSLAGSITAFYYAVIAPYKRHPMIKLMNELEYDASGVSANEFKFGLPFLNKSVALARFQWLSANIEYKVTKEPYFSTPYMIKDIEGIRIAVVGITSEGLMRNEQIEMERDVSVEKATFSAKRWIRYIYEKEEPEFLIVLYHGGLSKMSRGTDMKDANQAEEIMNQIGIADLFITGHQHETAIEHDGQTLLVQAGQNAENIIHVEATFKKRRNSYELLNMKPEIIDLSQYDEQQELLDITYYDRKAIHKWKHETVSQTPINAHFDSFHELVSKQHPFIRLLHETIAQATETEITCVHLPLPNSKGLKGKLKNADIYHAYPHPDKPIDITLRGSQIKALIEESVAHLTIEDNEIKVHNMDPTLYLFWSGFDYTVDLSKPVHERVIQFNLRQDYYYRIAMTDYCYRNYRDILKEVTLHHIYPQSMPELIAGYLSEHSTIPQSKYQIVIEHGPTFT